MAKWRSEMRRFDEDFRPLDSASLRYCLEQIHLEGDWPAQYSRAIVHLELLRRDEHLRGGGGKRRRPGLLELVASPRFGLTIVDEAHHVRNPGTSSHELIRYLCDESESVLFLSATPVHLGSRNLFALLNLLRPDLFPTQAVFDEMVRPNGLINAAMRHVRYRSPAESWQTDADAALAEAAGTTWGRQALAQDPRFSEWAGRLGDDVPLSDPDRVRCLRDLEEIHTLAHVMNRTRRRDIGRFTVRDPHTVSVPFTDQQRRFYDDLIAFRSDLLRIVHGPLVARLIVDNLERQAASCLPALLPTLDRVLRAGHLDGGLLHDAPEGEDEDDGARLELTGSLARRAEELRLRASELPANDPKWDRLRDIIREAVTSPGPGKVLVFSFFLHTLGYLEERIRAAGHRVAVVSGRVPDEERELLRRRFRLPREDGQALDVLLSSEVGCEGLDYEFCDRLVNYDIPWNPMRIEQRIGRIDRFGQMSEKVLIYNFITPGTVEERIFYRCFERLGIFRDTVGDLEEVLGEVVAELNRAVLDPSLTPAQVEAKARQLADNALRLAEEQRRLEEQGGSLLGLDEPFAAEVEDVQADARYVSPEDLRQMVERLLGSPELSGRIADDEKEPGLCRLRLNFDGRSNLLKELRGLGRNDRPAREFERALEGGESSIQMTFDPQAALEHREVPFVTPLHPLAGVAIRRWGEYCDPLAARLAVDEPRCRPGRYVFAGDLWETIAVRPGLRLVTLAWDLDRGGIDPGVSASLLNLIRRASDAKDSLSIPEGDLEEGFRRLEEEADALRRSEREVLRGRNATLIARKLASLELHHANRLGQLQDQAAKVADERIRRMREAERARIERDHDARREQIEGRKEADIITRRLAAGILEVRHGHRL